MQQHPQCNIKDCRILYVKQICGIQDTGEKDGRTTTQQLSSVRSLITGNKLPAEGLLQVSRLQEMEMYSVTMRRTYNFQGDQSRGNWRLLFRMKAFLKWLVVWDRGMTFFELNVADLISFLIIFSFSSCNGISRAEKHPHVCNTARCLKNLCQIFEELLSAIVSAHLYN